MNGFSPTIRRCQIAYRGTDIVSTLIAYSFDGKLFHHCRCYRNQLRRCKRRIGWPIRSNVEGSGFEPSTSNSTSSGARLIKVVQAIQTRLTSKFQALSKNFPLKFLCFLVGFYCATAFATVIGQTGDWDILSAGLAVAVVEGIGALAYKTPPYMFSSVRSVITLFNYWKAGLSLGLFLDSFKY